jgi:hypothetical protein
MEIGAQRTINKAGLVAGFAAPLCEPSDGSCESPSASEPRPVLIQLSDEDGFHPQSVAQDIWLWLIEPL